MEQNLECKLSIIVPCYNEELILNQTAKKLVEVLSNLIKNNKISKESFILFVDDGSEDKTWDIVEMLSKQYNCIKGIKLSSNRGHQTALIAGLEYVVDKCNCAITIDADLQQDPQAINLMVEKFKEGYEIVYGIKQNRAGESAFKKFFSEWFYRLMKLFGTNVVFNHADYRLLSRRAIEFLLHYKERNLFVRGIIPQIGLRSTNVYYTQFERPAGYSKYTLKKMINLAWDGITSFSIVPLRFISFTGFAIFVFSLLISLYVLAVKLFTNNALPGWTSTVLPIYFIGGIQLLSLGVIGEYIGKIYIETKQRPRYLIEKETDEISEL